MSSCVLHSTQFEITKNQSKSLIRIILTHNVKIIKLYEIWNFWNFFAFFFVQTPLWLELNHEIRLEIFFLQHRFYFYIKLNNRLYNVSLLNGNIICILKLSTTKKPTIIPKKKFQFFSKLNDNL